MQKAHKGARQQSGNLSDWSFSHESVSFMLAALLAVRDNHGFLEEVEMRFGI